MSGGTYPFTGRQFLVLWQFLANPSKRNSAQRMLLGKIRNRIERVLRQEEQQGLRVFARLKPSFVNAVRDGKPVLDDAGRPAKILEYDPVAIKVKQGELQIDTRERAALIDFMIDQIDGDAKPDEKGSLAPSADVAGDVLRIASWLGMGTELETRLLAAHPVDGYAGKIDSINPEGAEDAASEAPE